jgi:hypothetical protein
MSEPSSEPIDLPVLDDVAAVRLPGGERLPWLILVFEAALILSCYFIYFLVRGATEGSAAQATSNANDLVGLSRSLGILLVDDAQDLILSWMPLVHIANGIYIYGHWPFIAAIALWLLFYHPAAYRRSRNAFLVSGGIGLIIFATYPVAPPRLLDLGLVDTVTEYSNAYRVLQPPALTNQYAAMPSLHVGWNLLIGIALFQTAHLRVFKLAGLLSPVLMGFAAVSTANHFVIDIVAGGALGLFGLWVAANANRWGRSALAMVRRGARSPR